MPEVTLYCHRDRHDDCRGRVGLSGRDSRPLCQCKCHAPKETPMDDLTRDDLLAIANAHLLNVVPGHITRVRVSETEMAFDSVLASPFTDHTPSEWVTILSRVDGHTVACDVLVQSRHQGPTEHVPGQCSLRPIED